ncbi:MAG: hypothetical protein IIW66_02315 [Bacteroidales bacterium]|nr:hypothetical protein [Bacteroidales bacterium]MBQ5864211.1 hypothetical protein [Bacteroidales bacterium]
MRKIIKRCVTKADANALKDKAIKMGFKASTFMKNGKYACMISSDKDIPEEIAKGFLGNCRNMAKQALLP